jgi:hypothetical protein
MGRPAASRRLNFSTTATTGSTPGLAPLDPPDPQGHHRSTPFSHLGRSYTPLTAPLSARNDPQ